MPLSKDQLIEKFNPENAANMTAEDLEIMRALTNDELKALAQAYPNQPVRKAYLILYDTSVKDQARQLFPLSTWQNLFNVRVGQAMKNLIPWDFKKNLPNVKNRATARRIPIAAPAQQRRIIDLTPQEAANELSQAIQNPPGFLGGTIEEQKAAGIIPPGNVETLENIGPGVQLNTATAPVNQDLERQPVQQKTAPITAPPPAKAMAKKAAQKPADGSKPADQEMQQID